ncbi:MAG TPA: tetratricopeptide repeat-containing sensor histidine kinase [Bacteroidia bacterium]|nr:tetratricopeptide repeat-containing sensor histidine kinase [Bacteroidia bacterium]
MILAGGTLHGGAKEKKADSLKKVLVTQTDTARVLTLIKLSQTMLSIDKDSALYYAMMLKREAEAWGKKQRVCEANLIMGTCYHHLNQQDSALHYKRVALAIAVDDHFEKGEALAASDIGLYMKEAGEMDSAIIYILRAIQILEKTGQEKPLGATYTNLGLIYYTQGEYDEALVYYRKGETVFSKFDDRKGRAHVLNNIAAVYDERLQHDSALYYYAIALDLRTQLEDEEGMSQTKLNMAVTYRNMGQYTTAKEMLLEVLEVKERINDPYGIASCCLELSMNFIFMKKYDLSERYVIQADSVAQKLGRKEVQRDVYKVYAELYTATGRHELAQDYSRKYQALADEIMNEEKFKVIKEMQTKYETDKKELENIKLKEQQRISDEAREKDRRQMQLLIGGIAVLALILGLSFFAYRTKIKSNELLAGKNDQISRQNNVLKELNKKLIDSEEELTELNATKDKLFSIISHDLGNPVNAIVNYNMVLRNQKDTMSRDEMASSLDKINLTLQPLQGFLDNLLHWSIQQRSGTSVRKEPVNVSEVIEETVALYNGSCLAKRLKVEWKVDPKLEITTDANMLRLIVRNILANAIKFSPVGETIVLIATVEGKHFTLEIVDRGAGLTSEKIAQLLTGVKVESGKGTLQESGTGLGLSLVNEYLKILDGKLEIESEAGKGCVFRVVLGVSG